MAGERIQMTVGQSPPRALWDELGMLVAEAVDADDHRLVAFAPRLDAFERRFGIDVLAGEAEPIVTARRFARVHAAAVRHEVAGSALERDLRASIALLCDVPPPASPRTVHARARGHRVRVTVEEGVIPAAAAGPRPRGGSPRR